MALYSPEFQREVIYLLANNVMFATNYGSLLSEKSFDLAPLQAIFGVVNQHMLTYERELDKKDLSLLMDEYVLERGWGAESSKIFKEEIREIYLSKPKSEEFVTDKVVQFVRRQAVRKAIGDSIDILEKSEDQLEKVLDLIDKAISLGTGEQDTKTLKDLIHLPDLYRDKYDPRKLIKTGFHRFDSALQGGMAPGELHVFIGPPGSGKSTFGCNIGAHNVATGKKVFHATFEIKDLDVLKHYALRVTGLTHSDFLSVSKDVWTKKMEKFRKIEDNLFVCYWQSKSINTLTVRAWIAKHRSSLNVSPDLIIIDYDDLLLPVTGDTDDMYEDSGKIYDDLIKLGDYFKCFPGDEEFISNGLNVRFDQLNYGDTVPILCVQNGCLRTVAGIALGQRGITNTLIHIKVDDGGFDTDNGQIIRCTPDHKIMTDVGDMVEAKDIKPGDRLKAICTYANYYIAVKTVVSVREEKLDKPMPVYCLHVPVIGNFAHKSGVVVSNCPVVTFAQPKRDAWEKFEKDEVIVSSDLAHSAKKAHKAYSVSSLNFKKGQSKGILFIDKDRRGESSVYIDIERDLTRSTFNERHKDYMLEEE